MNRTPLLILKQDAKEDVYFLSARDAQETNPEKKEMSSDFEGQPYYYNYDPL